MSNKIEIFDSTLRDGAQSAGVSFSVADKMNIVRALDEFGIPYIEAGNPGSNPKDIDFFRQIAKEPLKSAKIVAFGSTCRKGVRPENDANVQSLLSANVDTCAIFGKSSLLHAEKILGVSGQDNLNMIVDTIQFLRGKGKRVFFDAEHFFDGYRQDPEYALSTLKAAFDAGASRLILCDTNGGCFPEEIAEIVTTVTKMYPKHTGIHCHNDTGCAVANTLAAIRSGAVQAQGTFIGIGERSGNANLSTVIANLQLKTNHNCVPKLTLLTETARYVAEISNLPLDSHMPYVGTAAFAHKGGMHADGVSKYAGSFEQVTPESVGNARDFLLSEMSGRASVMMKLADIAPLLKKDSDETRNIIGKIKALEHEGFQFEAAGASFEMLVRRELGTFTPHFEICDYKIISSQNSASGFGLASAMVKIRVGERFAITADEGDGPVNAIDKALRKALKEFYPSLNMTLTDYKVRVIDEGSSTAATTRVLIESTDGAETWTTVGASKDIIAASMIALCDAIEYGMTSTAEYN